MPQAKFTIEQLKDRFVQPLPFTGCWLWLRGATGAGYGVIVQNYKAFLAHRLFYEHYHGAIPEGREIDHLCRVRLCVNPLHMQVVDKVTNVMRGDSPHARNARATHCIRNHDLANSYITPDGRRQCRICMYIRSKRWRENRASTAS